MKNQGNCGSCWAFASVETLESHWAIKTGILQELSEQFVLDCTPNPDQCGGTGGCNGGTASLAYDRLIEIGGIPSEWTYPYLSVLGDPGECHGLPLPPAKPHSGVVSAAATITGYRSTVPNSYADMMYTLATVGPLVISVDAEGWHDYSSGVFDGEIRLYEHELLFGITVGFRSRVGSWYFLDPSHTTIFSVHTCTLIYRSKH